MRRIPITLAFLLLADPLLAGQVITAISISSSAGPAALQMDVRLAGPARIPADATGSFLLSGGSGGLIATFSDDLYAGQILPRDWMGWGMIDLVAGRPRYIMLGSYGWSVDSEHYPLEWLQWDLDLPPGGGIGQSVWGWIPDENINVSYSAQWPLDRMTISTSYVPEPGVWASLIFGLGLTGAMLRHRVRPAAVASRLPSRRCADPPR